MLVSLTIHTRPASLLLCAFQDMLLRGNRVRSYSAYAATFVAVWRIDRTALVALLQEFPKMR
jgi:CRP-like cAMP-binding protein